MILQIIDRNPTKYSIQSPAREALSSFDFSKAMPSVLLTFPAICFLCYLTTSSFSNVE
jgi:hypothetical protein